MLYERLRWLHLFGLVQHNAYLLQKVNTTYYAHFLALAKSRRFLSTRLLNLVGISISFSSFFQKVSFQFPNKYNK